jgi:hypothetical protein
MKCVRPSAPAMIVLALGACGGGSGAPDADVPAPNFVINCGASDEGWLAMKDLVDTTGAQVDTMRAAKIASPSDGAVLSRATPPTFTWLLPALRHGIDSGTFIWLHFHDGGLPMPVDVISVSPGKIADGGTGGCMSWTPAAADWAKLALATGTVTLDVYTAKEDLNVVTQGPFQPTTSSLSYTLGP